MRELCQIHGLCGQHCAAHSLYRRRDVLLGSPGSALESEPSALLCRVGDTYPNQHLETVVRVHFYRWRPKRKCGESGYPTVRS